MADVPKRVTLRAIGPSLAARGVTGTLSDPVLELYDSSGTLVAQNDNSSTLPPEKIPTDFQPTDGRESIITMRLPQGAYTAVLRGANGSTGVGLFELYDLAPIDSQIVNISTRGEVGNGNDTMIGGFIIGGQDPTKVIVRAIGPSLAKSNITNPLLDPSLELYDSNGALIFANGPTGAPTKPSKSSIPGVPPNDDREAAIVATLEPGGYTRAGPRRATSTQGVALVEVYDLASQQ